MLTASALALLVNVATAVFKQYIFPKWGRIGVQVVVFTLAFIGAAFVSYGHVVANLQTVVTDAIALFCLAVTFYEVIWQYFPWFSTGQKA